MAHGVVVEWCRDGVEVGKVKEVIDGYEGKGRSIGECKQSLGEVV